MVSASSEGCRIEPKVAPWDLAAAQVILEEAGAVFFAFDGERSIYKGSAVACTPGIEGEMRAFFKASLNGAV